MRKQGVKAHGVKAKARRIPAGRVKTAFGLPYRILVVLFLCTVLAGYSLWAAGITDSAVAKDVRGSSVYVGATWTIDQPAAEAVVGNRRLVVMFIDEPRPSPACDDVGRAAAGTLAVIVYRDRDDPTDTDIYGCSLIPGLTADENLGRAAVVETKISAGAEGMVEPIDLLKVVAANFDNLVRLDYLPGDARSIEASAPRYLLAFTALGAVVLGAAAAWFLGRRAGRELADHEGEGTELADRRAELDAELAGLAGQLLRTVDDPGAARDRDRINEMFSRFGDLSRSIGRIGSLPDDEQPALLVQATRQLADLRRQLRRVRGGRVR